jgi:hypothetical protein
MSTKIPAGLILGKCVLCSHEFRVLTAVNNSGDEEFWFAGREDIHPFLGISKLTYLLTLGWLVLGKSNDAWNTIVKRHAGIDLREFAQSSTCPNCFPSGVPSRSPKKTPQQDVDDDPPAKVQSLLIKSNGDAKRVLVSENKSASEILKCTDVEYFYDRENGIFVYYSLDAAQKSELPNVYGSALCNSYIAGDCLVISDLDSGLNRRSEYMNLTDDWFDPAILKMIQRCNTDADARAFLQQHKP